MPSWKKVIVSGSDASLNSLTVTGNTIITGSLAVGTSSIGPFENTLTLGARDSVAEGGQLGFNAPGGTYTSASFIDLYQNRLRILKGTNATSTGEVANWNMHNLQMALPAYSSVSSFPGTAAGFLAFDSSGNIITAAGSAGSPFPFTGSAQITGSLGITGSLLITGSTTTDLVRITQTGTGNAFVVEDSTNPDTSSFTITNAGDVGIGIATDTQHKLIVKGTGISGIYGIGGTAGVQGTGGQYGVYGYVDGNSVTGVGGQNLYGIGTNAIGVRGSAINGIGVVGVGGIYGGQFSVDNQNGSPIGVYATVSSGENAGTGAYIAGKFDASGGEQNYAVQLIDGSQGAGKVLVSQTADGKANWSTQLSGSYALTGSLRVTAGITGSLQGTSSFAITSSYASYSTNASDILIYVKNTTGTQINKGKVVRITGATGDNALIATASYESDSVSANTLGITREDIANDAFGYVITEGTLIGINTELWTAGQLLFLGANGSITGSAPLAPLHAVRLGQVLRVQQNNGSMYVRIDNGYELNELHDVDDNTTTASYGDLLVKSGSVWTNSRQLTGSYALTGSLTVTGSTTTNLVRITQTGTGNAFVVEDSANPDATPFTIDASGNTMIGTTSSLGPLTVRGDGATGVTMDTDAAAGQDNQSTRLFFKVSGSGRDISIRNFSGSFVLGTRGTSAGSSGTSVMVISASGDTGIGSGFTPSAARVATLQVSGNISIEAGDAYKQDGNNVIYIAKGADAFYANTIGGPGAGTTGLLRQTVYGWAAGALATGSFQTAVGVNAGYLNSGSNQTVIGALAGYLNSGSSQTAIGSNAGYQNSGNDSTSIGYLAGRSNSGYGQVAIGAYTGQYNIGLYQTAVGQQAGLYNTGSNQTAIGALAGLSNSGSNQTAIGYSAGLRNSGSNQTAVGLFAGVDNLSSNQTAIGRDAGYKNSGSNQTAVGLQAGLYNTGSNQTAVGVNAGNQNAGNDNTNIGYQAGLYTIGTTNNTGSVQSVFLGSTTYAGGLNRTNQIVIGYNASGIGSNSVVLGNDSILTTALKGFVGIGTTSPTASLHITNTSTSASFLVEDNTNPDSTPFIIDATGNVGIGTTTPNAKLDVNGNTIITGSLTVTNGLTVNNTLFTSTTATANVGSTTIYSVSTSSYDGAWFEYVARSGSNARAGQIMAIDSGSAVNFTETTTTDFGSTSGLSLGVYIVNGAMALTASAATDGWSIKTIVRSI